MRVTCTSGRNVPRPSHVWPAGLWTHARTPCESSTSARRASLASRIASRGRVHSSTAHPRCFAAAQQRYLPRLTCSQRLLSGFDSLSHPSAPRPLRLPACSTTCGTTDSAIWRRGSRERWGRQRQEALLISLCRSSAGAQEGKRMGGRERGTSFARCCAGGARSVSASLRPERSRAHISLPWACEM